jgi:hypothetical protein
VAIPDYTDCTPEVKEPRWCRKFLQLLGQTGIVSAAAQGAGIERRTVYARRDKFPAFAAEWEEAARLGDDVLEDTARKRALKASDTLLIFLLKGAKPEKYRERMDLKHSGEIAIGEIADRARAKLAAIVDADAGEGGAGEPK